MSVSASGSQAGFTDLGAHERFVTAELCAGITDINGGTGSIALMDGGMYGPIISHSVPHEIHRRMLTLIEDKGLLVGDRLPPERDLAKALNVSRTSLRDALRSLAEHGVLASRHGAGWFVILDDVSAVRGASLRYQLSDIALDQMVEARIALEPVIAAHAAVRRTENDLKALTTLLDRLDATTDTRRYVHLDKELHLLLARCSYNPYLSLAVRPVLDRMEESRQDMHPVLSTGASIAEHRRILTAIERGDAKAAKSAMTRHLTSFKRRTATLFNADDALEVRN